MRFPSTAVWMLAKCLSCLVVARNRDARETGADRAFCVEIEPELVILGGGEHPRQVIGGSPSSPRREAVPDPASGLEEPADLPVGDRRHVLGFDKHAREHDVFADDPAVGDRQGAAPVDPQLEPTGQVIPGDVDQPRHDRRGHASRHTRFHDKASARGRIGNVAKHPEISGLRALPRGGVTQQRVNQSSRLVVPDIDRHPRSPLRGLPVQDRNRIVLLLSDLVPQFPDLIHHVGAEAVDRLLTQRTWQV